MLNYLHLKFVIIIKYFKLLSSKQNKKNEIYSDIYVKLLSSLLSKHMSIGRS